jgi:mercuric ion binding protein
MKKIILIPFLFYVTLFAAEREVKIEIEGMTCPLCTTAIKKSLKQLPCVEKAKVKLSKEEAKVRFDDTKCEPDALLKAIEKAGYEGRFK